MTTGTELAVREISLPVWETANALGKTVRESGMFKVKTQAGATAIMLKGYELGFGFMAAFEFIHDIDGQVSLSPKGALAIVQRSGMLEKFEIIEEREPIRCTVTMKRRGGLEYTSSFSVEDADTARLRREDKPESNWWKYPANMCKWRAIGFCIDMVFADVTGGLKRADEFGADLTASGDVIEGSWTVAPVSQPKTSPKRDESFETELGRLIEEFSVAAILEANADAMPKTVEDIHALRPILAAASVPMSPEEFAALEPMPH